MVPVMACNMQHCRSGEPYLSVGAYCAKLITLHIVCVITHVIQKPDLSPAWYTVQHEPSCSVTVTPRTSLPAAASVPPEGPGGTDYLTLSATLHTAFMHQQCHVNLNRYPTATMV